jgi:putative thioredoxin
LADELQGAFVVAKVNVDENPGLAQAFGVSSIPLVVGIRDGKAVSEFLGALPESQVRAFLAQLLPSEAMQLAARARELRAAGQSSEAEAAYRRALSLDARCDRALLGLAELLVERGEQTEALALLDRIAPGTPERQDADRIAAALRVQQAGDTDETALLAQLEQNPADLETRFALAQALAARAQYEAALDQYLDIVKRNRGFRDDGARKAMLDIYELLGSDSEIVQRSRSALSRVLFS